jgi:hypothetical protein
VGGTKTDRQVPVHICMGRPNSILEMAVHGMPTEALELLRHGGNNDLDGYPTPSLTTVRFLTPRSGHPSALTLVEDGGRLSVAQFSATWSATTGPLPTPAQISAWNARSSHGNIYRSDDQTLVVSMDVDLKNMPLQQVIPVWLDWDRCVEDARALVASAGPG